MEHYIETHIKEETIRGIDTLIEILEDIRNSKNINKYMITAKMKPYYMRNHTKENRVETTQIGSKIEITISEGMQKNVENTSIGQFIIDDE